MLSCSPKYKFYDIMSISEENVDDMKSFLQTVRGKIHRKSLRTYAACMFTGVIALALAVSGVFFYAQTASV